MALPPRALVSAAASAPTATRPSASIVVSSSATPSTAAAITQITHRPTCRSGYVRARSVRSNPAIVRLFHRAGWTRIREASCGQAVADPHARTLVLDPSCPALHTWPQTGHDGVIGGLIVLLRPLPEEIWSCRCLTATARQAPNCL